MNSSMRGPPEARGPRLKPFKPIGWSASDQLAAENIQTWINFLLSKVCISKEIYHDYGISTTISRIHNYDDKAFVYLSKPLIYQ